MHMQKKYSPTPDFFKQLSKRGKSCWLEVKIGSINSFIFSIINSQWPYIKANVLWFDEKLWNCCMLIPVARRLGVCPNKVSRGCHLCLSCEPPPARTALPGSSCSLVFLPGWCAGWSRASSCGLCAWPVAAGRVRELGSSPAPGMPPSVTSSVWDGAGSEARSVCRPMGPRRASWQGTGIPGARLALPYLEPRAQPHICYHRPWRTSWCYPVSLNWHRRSFGCSRPQFICGGNNTL